jgi:hypothetical protein
LREPKLDVVADLGQDRFAFLLLCLEQSQPLAHHVAGGVESSGVDAVLHERLELRRGGNGQLR